MKPVTTIPITNIVLVADSGYFFSDDETVVSVGDYEWGTPSNHTNLEIKEMSTQLRVCGIYAVDLPDESQSTTISAAAIENVKFDYQPGDAPRATAKRAANQYNYDILYECWQQFENNQPVAAWYSDNDSHGSLPTITAFENGKTYVYSIMLKPKDGYSFSSETVITVNGNAVTAGPATDGYLSLPNVKTITPTGQITPPRHRRLLLFPLCRRQQRQPQDRGRRHGALCRCRPAEHRRSGVERQAPRAVNQLFSPGRYRQGYAAAAASKNAALSGGVFVDCAHAEKQASYRWKYLKTREPSHTWNCPKR